MTLELFNANGEFAFIPSESDLAELDDAARERWQVVAEAMADHDARRLELEASKSRVVALMADVSKVEGYLRKHYPPMTPTDAAKLFIKTEQEKRR